MGEPIYLPTPDDIARETAAIRATWDAATERSRRCAGFGRVAWSVPGADQHAEIVDAATLRAFQTAK